MSSRVWQPAGWRPECGHHGWSIRHDYRARGARGFDGHKRVKGRKRHILVETLGTAHRQPSGARQSDCRAGARLLGGLSPLFPWIRTVIAHAGHQSRKLARELMREDGWKLQIVKRRQRTFKIARLIWIVECSLPCLLAII